ncbi:MAG TPA: GldM family protein [Chryseosolibacter sp.]
MKKLSTPATLVDRSNLFAACGLLLLAFTLLPGILRAQQKDSVKLYLKCRNDLLLTYFNPNYNAAGSVLSVKGGRLIENRDNNRIAIMPDSAVVVLDVRRKGKLESSFTMYSVAPPPPEFEATINGKRYWPFSAASGPLPASIGIDPVSDVSFKEIVPKDANYTIVKWEVSLNRNGKSLRRISVTENKMPASALSKIKAVAQSGDVIEVKVITMQRKNALGETVPQPITFPALLYTIKP